MKGNPWKMLRHSISFGIASFFAGSLLVYSMIKYTPPEKAITDEPKSEKDLLEIQTREFRRDWLKNRQDIMSKISEEQKEYMAKFDKTSAELPEEAQNILNILDGKDLD
ncbi:hypothetical protein SteCoe_20798 [Stentor coeruleus]|uniref:Uncharacterized protein n=1 Tax=Stentor coeruleus TaxID=5963 RepID=A0A1R2BRM8_9CILI|nr:hypothetical protein SteCoe_20798 [Stentor coeruleus]